MRTALFHNFTDKPFTGYWNGKPKTFKAGEQKYMPEYLAAHYAKHLTNQELLREGKETSTSPKFPEQVPDFMAIFNKAFIVEDDEQDDDEAGVESEAANMNRTQPSMNITTKPNKPIVGPGREPQIVSGPADDEDENFEGLKDNNQ